MQPILLFFLVASVCAKTSARSDILQQVHETSSSQASVSTECALCQAIVNLIDAQVKESNATIEIIEQLVRTVCKTLRSEACEVILKNLDKIIQWIEEEVDPKDICVRLKICSSKSLKTVKMNEQFGSARCTACKTVMGVIWFEVKIANKTIEEIEAAVKEVCKLLMSEVCEVVLKQLDQIIQMIENGLKPEQICEKFKFCPPGIAASKKEVEQNGSCEVCLEIVNLIHYDIEYANATVEMVEELLKDLCAVTHSPLCEEMIKEVDNIIQWLENGMDPEGICQKLHICPQQKIKPYPNVHKLKQLTNCSVCEVIIQLIEMMVVNFNASLSEIQEAVDGMCLVIGTISKGYQKECSDISSKVESIVNDIKNKKSVLTICDGLGYCKSSFKAGPSLCENCKVIVGFIQSQIKLANASIEIIEKVVMLICKTIGSVEEKVCKAIISNLDYFIQMLEKGLEPTKICQELGLCPSLQHKEQMINNSPNKLLV